MIHEPTVRKAQITKIDDVAILKCILDRVSKLNFKIHHASETENTTEKNRSTVELLRFNFDFETYIATFQAKKFRLWETKSGHYKIFVLPKNSRQAIVSVLITKQACSDDKQFLTEKQVAKIHQQFGHCKIEPLRKLLSSAKIGYESAK